MMELRNSLVNNIGIFAKRFPLLMNERMGSSVLHNNGHMFFRSPRNLHRFIYYEFANEEPTSVARGSVPSHPHPSRKLNRDPQFNRENNLLPSWTRVGNREYKIGILNSNQQPRCRGSMHINVNT